MLYFRIAKNTSDTDFVIYAVNNGMYSDSGYSPYTAVKNADFVKRYSNNDTSDGTQENRNEIVASREGQACHIVMKTSTGSSEEDIQKYNSIFDQIINSLVLIPVPLG